MLAAWACVLGGCSLFVVLVYLTVVIPWRVNHRYLQGTCIVLDKRIVDKRPVGQAFRKGIDPEQYRPEVLIQYSVNGNDHQVWTYDSARLPFVVWRRQSVAQAILDQFKQGESYPCWYDPEKPDQAVLLRGYPDPWLVLIQLIPCVFVVLFGLCVHKLVRRILAVRRAPATPG
jgi:hypothetical protein